MVAAFRKYAPEDWPSLLDMYISFEPKGVYMGLPPHTVDQIAIWLRRLTEDVHNTHFLLWMGPQVIAHSALIFYPSRPRSQEIILFVHPDHQACGWGRKMFVGTLNWAGLNLEIDEVWLFVDWNNARARRLYASVGFTGSPSGLKDSEMLMKRGMVGELEVKG